VNYVTHNTCMATRRHPAEVRRAAPLWAQRLRDARQTLEWTLDESSKRMNGVISASRLGNYEQGTREPPLAQFARLAELYGVAMAWLVGAGALRSALSQEEIALVKDFRVLPERIRVELKRKIHVAAMTEKAPVDPQYAAPAKPAATQRRKARIYG